MRDDLATPLVTNALDMAITGRRPDQVIHHSDRGSQYTSTAFGTRCRQAGIAISMGRRGDAYDNAVAESFFATLETELLMRTSFANRDQARSEVFDYIEGFYNPHRRHSSIGYHSPTDYERSTPTSPTTLLTPKAENCPQNRGNSIPRFRAGCALAAASSATGWGVVLAVSTSAAMLCLAVVAGRADLDGPPPAVGEPLVTALAAVGYIGPVGLLGLLGLLVGWPGGGRSAARHGYAELAAMVVACVVTVLGTGVVCLYWLVEWLG